MFVNILVKNEANYCFSIRYCTHHGGVGTGC